MTTDQLVAALALKTTKTSPGTVAPTATEVFSSAEARALGVTLENLITYPEGFVPGFAGGSQQELFQFLFAAIGSGAPALSPTPLGNFFATDFTPANYHVVLPDGGATAEFLSDRINLSTTGGGGSLVNRLEYKGAGSMSKDRWAIWTDFIGNANPLGGAIGLEITGVNNVGKFTRIISYTVLHSDATNASNGVSVLANAQLDGTDFAQLTASTAKLSPHTTGDTYRMELAFTLGVFTLTTTRLNTGESNAISFANDFTHDPAAPSSRALPFNNYPAVFYYFGNYTITGFSGTTTVEKNAEVLLVGDSKWQGYNVGAYANRVSVHLAALRNTPVVNLSAAGDTVALVRLRYQEIVQHQPKRIILCVGRNDVFGNPFKAAYQALVSDLQALPFAPTVYHAQTMYETAQTNAELRAWLSATYAAAVIDTYTPTVGAANVAPDGVHITAAAAQIVANTLHAALPAFS